MTHLGLSAVIVSPEVSFGLPIAFVLLVVVGTAYLTRKLRSTSIIPDAISLIKINQRRTKIVINRRSSSIQLKDNKVLREKSNLNIDEVPIIALIPIKSDSKLDLDLVEQRRNKIIPM
jgi:hypothetical protein